MRIICSKEEAEILKKNCIIETCEFCFMSEVCSDVLGNGATISHLITISQEAQQSV